MEEILNRSSLIQSDKELLEKTLAKSPSELTKDEKGIIRARSSYLNAVERETFKSILENEVKEKEESKEVKTKKK